MKRENTSSKSRSRRLAAVLRSLFVFIVLFGACGYGLAACAVINSPAPAKAAGRVAEEIAITPIIPFAALCYGLTLGQPCFQPSIDHKPPPEVWRAAISPDGSNVVLVKGETLVVYDVNAKKWTSLSLAGRGQLRKAIFSSDSRHVAIETICNAACSGGMPRYGVAILNLDSKLLQQDIPLARSAGGVVFSQNGAYLITTTSCGIACSGDDAPNNITLYNVANGQAIQAIALPRSVSGVGLVISPDGTRLAFLTECLRDCPVGFKYDRVAILELTANGGSGTASISDLRYLDGDEASRSDLRFSPDSKSLIYRAHLTRRRTNGAVTEENANIGVVRLQGPESFREQFLEGDGFYSASPVGFTPAGDAVFVGLKPSVRTAEILKAPLSESDPRRGALSSFSSIPYAVPMTGGRLIPRIDEDFPFILNGIPTCAENCGDALYIAQVSDRGSHYELFHAHNGIAHQATHFNKYGSSFGVDDYSENGKIAIIDDYIQDVGRVLDIVDIGNEMTTALPIADFDRVLNRKPPNREKN